MRTARVIAIVLGVALAAGTAWAQAPARASGAQPSAQRVQGTPRIEVYVLNADAGPGGVDPALLQSLPQLSSAQFAALPHITLVSRSTLPLGAAPQSVSLPNGSALLITSQGRLPNGRHEVTVQVQTPSGAPSSIQFSAAPHTPFFRVRMLGANRAEILAFVVH